jgi:glycosyltransferase involved in cell wall biosynthesis
MNILLINHYAGSERLGMELRPFYLGREWVRSGHRVTILAASFSHLRNAQPEVAEDLQESEESGVRFSWLRANRYEGNTPRRIANMLTFVGKAMAFAKRLAREQRPDVVICSSTYPLDIYPGERIARLAGSRLVFEVHDLWPLTPVLVGGYSAAHPYIRILQKAEDRAYRVADKVVSLLPDADRYMLTRGMHPAKFIHIPNGVDVTTANPGKRRPLSPEIREKIESARRRGCFLVGYAGGLAPSNCVEQLLEGAKLLQGEGVAFLILGSGSERESLAAEARRSNLENFHLLGRADKASVQTFLAAMDVLTVVLKRSPLYAYGISLNKLFEYMLSAKPIVQAIECSNDLVARADCGLTVPPEDPHALADAVRLLRRLAPQQRNRLGENGHTYVLREHDYRVLAERFLRAVSDPDLQRPAAPRPAA